MRHSLSNKFNGLAEAVQDYLRIHMKLAKLGVLEKMTRMSMFTINTLVMFLLGTVFFLFASAAFVVWYGTTFGDFLTGILIIIGLIVLVGLIFFLTRKNVITSFVMKNLSSILFEEDEDID